MKKIKNLNCSPKRDRVESKLIERNPDWLILQHDLFFTEEYPFANIDRLKGVKYKALKTN